jgi:hypothetical protein
VHRSEAQYYRDQADRLLALAKRCSDSEIRVELTNIASEWVERAKTINNKRVEA